MSLLLLPLHHLLHLHLLSSALGGVSSHGAFGACRACVAADVCLRAHAPSVHQSTCTQTASITPCSLSSCPGTETTAHHHVHRLPSPLLSSLNTQLICTLLCVREGHLMCSYLLGATPPMLSVPLPAPYNGNFSGQLCEGRMGRQGGNET